MFIFLVLFDLQVIRDGTSQLVVVPFFLTYCRARSVVRFLYFFVFQGDVSYKKLVVVVTTG